MDICSFVRIQCGLCAWKNDATQTVHFWTRGLDLFDKGDARGPRGGRIADRRVQRTQTLLHKALMSLILEKKYESITVQEILDRADVGRSTFYAHFRDKDELLVSGFENVRSLLESAQASAGEFPAQSYERIIGFS